MHGGRFSVQMSAVYPFRIPVDQCIEETVNKDTITSGGTKGFSSNPSTLHKYYLTAEYHTIFIRNMREMVSFNRYGNDFDHPNLHKTRIVKDENTVQTMVDILGTSWKNPLGDAADLQCLSTGATHQLTLQMTS